MRRSVLSGLWLLLLAAVPAPAQAPKLTEKAALKSVRGEFVPSEAKPGQTVTLRVIVELNSPDYLTYPLRQPDPLEKDSQNELAVPTGGDLIFVDDPIPDPAGLKRKKGPSGTLAYYPGGAVWELKAVVSPKATAGDKTVALKTFRVIICDAQSCLAPKRYPVSATIHVTSGSLEVDAAYRTKVDQALAGGAVGTPKETPKVANPKETKTEPVGEGPKAVGAKVALARDYAADMKEAAAQFPPPDVKGESLFVFLLTAATFGFITLLTPCVFPMVPITVSIFIKQGEKKGTNPLAQATVYAVTIIIVLGIAAVSLLTFFYKLSVHPLTNVLLGLLFIVFTLSLFGMFELTLPSFLTDMVSKRAGAGGYVGTVFMAISFTIVSFTCVAPFLGGFSGMASSGKYSQFEISLAGFVFAATFALPFFVLALFPSLLRKLPRSGGWMDTIKVVMGFLELAAALKFFRTAELRWTNIPVIFTYDAVLAIWIGLLIALGLYLIGLFKVGHEDPAPHPIGAFRLILAIGALGMATYLAPALINLNGERVRPGGTVYAWVDSFLLPEPSAIEVAKGELAWSGDLRRSLDSARARGDYVFIDFTGKTCTNCKLNEKNVFTKPEITKLLKQYTLVQLYTDDVPDEFYDAPPGRDRVQTDGDINRNFEKSVFGQEQLPLYVIAKPESNGKVTVIGVYGEGKINDEEAFKKFLRRE